MSCCHRCVTDQQFDARIARRDLRRFRRRGPDPHTRQMLAAVRQQPLPPNPTLLDVGGGVGTIHHVLLEQGFSHATHVDASVAYLAAASDEAQQRNHASRVDFRLMDFSSADGIPAADVVTLDRVVCCDPDYQRLLTNAANHARRLVAFSFPRPRLVVRLFVRIMNIARRLSGSSFSAYVHPPAGMAEVLQKAGMHRSWSGGTWIWAVQIFEREPRTV